MHKSGFINIIGRPNVGKSTLMNAMVGERMSAITNKPQTTRHRIVGILSDEDFQMVFSDTPGVVQDPSYKMHESMNKFAYSSFEDADIMIFATDMLEKWEADAPIIERLKTVKVPLLLVLNKIDIATEAEILQKIAWWSNLVNFTEIVPISALNKTNTDRLFDLLKNNLPEGPAYYPKDQLTDRPERFFVSEIIREKILLLYKQEIPYSVEVVVIEYKVGKTKSDDDIVRIRAEIYVSRKTQKSIIIGKNGMMIKKLGQMARKDIETFVDSKVFLELHVKVKENWRDDDRMLKHFGY